MQITAAVVGERSGPFTIGARRTVRPASRRGDRQGGRERHVPDRPAWPRRLLRQSLSKRVRPRGRGRRACGRRRRAHARAGRPCRDVVSVVRRLRQLRSGQAQLLRACLSAEDAGHARRRLDAVVQGRQAGLQRLLPAVVIRHLCAHPGALRREGAQRRAARTARAARLQRADRRRRGAQCHQAEARRQFRGVRRRRGRPVRADGGEDRRLRSHHRGRHPCAPARARA